MDNVVYVLDPETALFRAIELVGAISLKPISDLLGCKSLTRKGLNNIRTLPSVVSGPGCGR
ncbi:hypothetical protein ABIE78_000237 [Sinorhizobium fredii]